MGMSAQVAFSSLLAFFPAMVFLVGLLDLIGAYETLQGFLAPVAPGDVLDTIDTLQRDGRQVVVTTDCHPRLADKLLPELADRLLAGAVWGLMPPDDETRLDILRRKSTGRSPTAHA